MDFSSGGKKVIERLVEAYGFSTRQALCDHLGVSKSTMATRYMRDIFLQIGFCNVLLKLVIH